MNYPSLHSLRWRLFYYHKQEWRGFQLPNEAVLDSEVIDEELAELLEDAGCAVVDESVDDSETNMHNAEEVVFETGTSEQEATSTKDMVESDEESY